MCVAHLPVSVQTLVYLESKPFPNQLHRGLWLSEPEQETEDKNTWLKTLRPDCKNVFKDSNTVALIQQPTLKHIIVINVLLFLVKVRINLLYFHTCRFAELYLHHSTWMASYHIFWDTFFQCSHLESGYKWICWRLIWTCLLTCSSLCFHCCQSSEGILGSLDAGLRSSLAIPDSVMQGGGAQDFGGIFLKARLRNWQETSNGTTLINNHFICTVKISSL